MRETLSEAEYAEVRALAEEKYRSWEWTYGRSPDYDWQNRKRFPGGTLEIRMQVHAGRIEDIVFYGDYMATASQTELTEALRGIRPEREALREVFARFDMPALFGGIREEEILELLES